MDQYSKIDLDQVRSDLLTQKEALQVVKGLWWASMSFAFFEVSCIILYLIAAIIYLS